MDNNGQPYQFWPSGRICASIADFYFIFFLTTVLSLVV